nr:MAG TPA: hypothetical protein [Caudoviricetes sp.]
MYCIHITATFTFIYLEFLIKSHYSLLFCLPAYD